MMQTHIVIACEGAATVPYTKIKNFQGDLKDISPEDYERLKEQILDHGFNSPVHVWKHRNQLWNLDGHQRIKVLSGLEDEGYKIPDIPINYIKAKNMADAKRILLSKVSQYGKVTPQGMYNFMADANITNDEMKEHFRIPDLDFDKFNEDFFGEPRKTVAEGAKEIDTDDYASSLVHKCPRCGFKFGKGAPNAQDE